MTQQFHQWTIFKNIQSINSKGDMHPKLHSSIIYKLPRYRSNLSVHQQTSSLSTMEYYSAIKKNEILPFTVTWIDLEGIMLSEISQTEKDVYHIIILLIYAIQKIQQTSKKKQTHRQNKSVVPSGEREVAQGHDGVGD